MAVKWLLAKDVVVEASRVTEAAFAERHPGPAVLSVS
jgi:hypothetical protein